MVSISTITLLTSCLSQVVPSTLAFVSHSVEIIARDLRDSLSVLT